MTKPVSRTLTSFDGTSLYTESWGEGYPLVLCDGLGCSGFIWQHLRHSLSSDYRLIHWHYRGHGQSGAPPQAQAMRMEDLLEDLKVVCGAYDLEQPIFIGHSLGAQLILSYALQSPEKVKALVSLCGSVGHPLHYFHSTDHANRVFPWLRLFRRSFPELSQKVWSRVMASEFAYQFAVHVELTPVLARRRLFYPYFEQLADMDVELFSELLYHANRHSVEERLGELSHPALIVGGERDTFTPLWIARKMASTMPNAELCVVPGGSHTAPIEIPELIYLRLDRFLKAHLSPPKKKKRSPAPQKTKTQKTSPKPRQPKKKSRRPSKKSAEAIRP
jgi:pimeloyl-ACP methyl ester carboxylesterase